MRIELKPRLVVNGLVAMGPGKAELLGRIDETGSISAAAKAMGMSYRRAWLLVEAMNTAFKAPLVATAAGGARGGGATVTDMGREVLADYRALAADVAAAAAAHEAAFAARLRRAV